MRQIEELVSFRLAVIVLAMTSTITAYSQQTVGLFTNSEEAFDGYTLFAPLGSTTTYLINNCGEKVHSWPSTYRPGQAVYLLENGNLLRTGNTNNAIFDAGGTGGIIEIIDWDGSVIWDYTISSVFECQHHDIAYLPNGNILAIVWDAYTEAEASAAGRISSGETLWAEKIIEIQPDFETGEGTIVWEWKAWDHLIQDQNQQLSNYGTVAEAPELIDLNFVAGNPSASDWLHINSVDYSAELDQIVLSNHNFSEVWIIDHSTTTAEASSHTGGNAGKGGDLLYRWGNPQAYNQGSENDQILFSQHNAYWIESAFPDGDLIMIFNNQAGMDFSEVAIINPPINLAGGYDYSGNAYEPVSFQWAYTANPEQGFFAANISGAQRLENGNTLICEGTTGRFFEINYAGDIVWEYVNPVAGNGIISQGAPAMNNRAFRAERYATDFPGFTGRNLVSQGYIESGSNFSCTLISSTNTLENIDFRAYPIPVNDELTIESPVILNSITLYNSTGKKVLQQSTDMKTDRIDLSQLASGIYFLEIMSSANKRGIQKLIID